MSNIPMVDLQTQYKNIVGEIDAAIKKVIDSSYFIGGPVVKSFTENLSKYQGGCHVIPCANGTDALQIALMALELKPGDEVITTPFTFVATAEVIALLRLKVTFVDVEYDSYNMDVAALEKAVSAKTKAIIPVHLFGQCSNMEAINEIADKYNIPTIEDNAQSIGASYQFSSGERKMSGTIGTIGCTSFFPSKNLGAYGDGGAIFTTNEQLSDKIRLICNHGSKVRYYHEEVGVNSRLDAIQAAVLDVKLKKLDEYNKNRRKAAHYYTEQLSDLTGVLCPIESSFTDHVYHQYTLKISDGRRDMVHKHLSSLGIASGIYYPVPLHIQKAYSDSQYKEGDFPVSEKLAKEVLSLPIHSEMTKEIQDRIISALKEVL